MDRKNYFVGQFDDFIFESDKDDVESDSEED